MITPVYSNRKLAKIRFFAAYALSVLLILVLYSYISAPVSGSLEEIAPPNQQPHSYVKRTASATQKDEYYNAVYQTLDKRMRRLDSICSKVSSNRSAANLGLLQQEEVAFYTEVEKIRLAATSISDVKKQNEIAALLDEFSRAAKKQIDVAMNTPIPGETNNQLEELKGILLQKEQKIAELEDQNRLLLAEKDNYVATSQSQTNATARMAQREPDNGAAEWKTRYERLKSDNEKLKESNNRFLTQTNELKKSYKEIVDDNRRLLAQLQAARSARN